MRYRMLVLIALSVCLALMAGCASSPDDPEAHEQVETAADLIVGLWTADATLIGDAIATDVEDLDPTYLGELGAMDSERIERSWDGDVLTLTYDGEQEPFVLTPQTDSDPPTVIADASGSSMVFVMEEDESGGWIVSAIDDMAVTDFITLVTALPSDPAQEGLICHTSQLIVELAYSTYLELNGEASTDPDDYGDLIEETRYCPHPDSQYSSASSDSGYFIGLDDEGSLEPCSVHGYHEEALQPAD